MLVCACAYALADLAVRTGGGHEAQSIAGYCGTHKDTDTEAEDGGEGCRSSMGKRETPTNMRDCARLCLCNSHCRYATFSAHTRDCSLYASCDTTRLAQGHGYHTIDLGGCTGSLRGRNDCAVALSGEPPPPPPSPPLPPPPPPGYPLERGEAACPHPAVGDGRSPVFSVMGTSNTAGSNSVRYFKGRNTFGKTHQSFAMLLQRRLEPAFETVSNRLGAMGPTHLAACVSRYVPPETRAGVVEFLPSMGYQSKDDSEVDAVAALLQALRQRGAFAALVNVIPGEARFRDEIEQGWCGREKEYDEARDMIVGCNSKRHVLHLHNATVARAVALGAQVVSLDADEHPELFGPDSYHMNAAGHRRVFNELWARYRVMQCGAFRSGEGSMGDVGGGGEGAGLGVSCAVGDELQPLVAKADGFERVDLSSSGGGGGGGKREPKVVWEARLPGASLTLCLPLPRTEAAATEAYIAHLKDPGWGPNAGSSSQLDPMARYKLLLGLQMSHARNLPLYGVAYLSCSGACGCARPERPERRCTAAAPCPIDTLTEQPVTITRWFEVAVSERDSTHHGTLCRSADACMVQVRNSAPEGEARHRVHVRAAIFGVNDWRVGARTFNDVL